MKIPACIKVILIQCGFDNLLSIQTINERLINDTEVYAAKNLVKEIGELKCCHCKTYHGQIANKRFEFVPGHRALILELGKQCSSQEFLAQFTTKTNNKSNESAFSNLLAELVNTAHANFEQSPHLNRYSDLIKYFAMYMFMACGKFCYEIICRNLPMPATSTVRKYLKSLVVSCLMFDLSAHCLAAVFAADSLVDSVLAGVFFLVFCSALGSSLKIAIAFELLYISLAVCNF